MRAQPNAQRAGRRPQLGHSQEASAEEIFLTQMAKISAELPGKRGMIVYDQAHSRWLRDGQKGSAQNAHLFERRSFGAQLDEISAAVTEAGGH
jgi:hypothetical protein